MTSNRYDRIAPLLSSGLLAPGLTDNDLEFLKKILDPTRGPIPELDYWSVIGPQWQLAKSNLNAQQLGMWLETNRGHRTKIAFQRGLHRWQNRQKCSRSSANTKRSATSTC